MDSLLIKRPTGRLAPTPSGELHLGNLLAFAAAWLRARQAGGELLLRVEDLDQARCRDESTAELRAVLDWLGLGWDREVSPQSLRGYDEAFRQLGDRAYFCQCTRRTWREAGFAIYPGTCRELGLVEGALRFRLPDGPRCFEDLHWGAQRVDLSAEADPVLRRRDGVVSYNLAVVWDDIRDGVQEIVRGADLLSLTATQLCLREALGGGPVQHYHSPVVLGPDGRKLSKSHASVSLSDLRGEGWSPEDVWRQVLPWLGMAGASLEDGLSQELDPVRGVIQLTELSAQRWEWRLESSADTSDSASGATRAG